MAFNSIVVLSAAFLAVCSAVSGRAVTNDEYEFGTPLTGGVLVRTVTHPSFVQPVAVPVRDHVRPVVNQGLERPVYTKAGVPVVVHDGLLGTAGLGRSELPATARQYSSGVQVPVPVQVQSAGVPLGQPDNVNSGYVFNSGSVPFSIYPGNVPVVNNNYGYNSGYGYIPYYYTYSAGYIPQPVPQL